MLDHSWLNRIGFSVILGGGLLAMVSNSLLVLPVILFGIVLMGVGFLGWERSTGEFPPIDRTLLSDDTAPAKLPTSELEAAPDRTRE